MKLRCINSGLGIESGREYPVLSESKLAWVIVIGQLEKKVTKSTGLFAGAPKGGPSFELVTVTETQLDLIPKKRSVGRPKTGTALSPAEKQARYRARQAEKTVTVTFNRSDIPALKILLAQADLSGALPADEIDRLCKAVYAAALS
ncbi:hypothetical protein ACLH0G_03675 [Aeromonas rivipollensis]|uniref:hypothetical protein n=1 Tax=Aeromonas rivipollensis TaxID=948519 RepID=UPI003D088996